jgi:toxin ParE1/3/4
MTPKPVRRRRQARLDVEAAARHYRKEGGATLEIGFIEAVEAGMAHICKHPASGSLRLAHLLRIEGLRVWPMKRFPYLIFYIDTEAAVDVVRVLHGERDLPALLRGDR